MAPSLFSPNSHIRNSHYFPSRPDQYLPPPSSFSRSSGTTVKNSLKKIPSTFFSKEEKPSAKRFSGKIAILEDPPRATRTAVVDHRRPLISSPHRLNSTATSATLVTQPVTEKDKKNRTKTRKALADIFSWGGAHLSPSRKSVQSAKHSLSAPNPPPKDSQTMQSLLKKTNSRPLSNKSSQSGLSGYASLRVPQETPQSRARPSLGEDPFSRGGEGAEIVESIHRHGVASSIKASARSDRRTSVSSSKALSAKTLIGDEVSIKAYEPKFGVAPPAKSTPVAFDYGKDTTSERSSQAAIGERPVLTSLPPRSASLGQVYGQPRLPTPPPSVTFSTESKPGIISAKTLKKEQTKSRIWGFFVGKAKKESRPDAPLLLEQKLDHLSAPSVTPRSSLISMRAATLRAQMASGQPDTTRPIDPRPVSIIDSVTITAESTIRCDRPRPPILHIQKPSADVTKTLPLLTGTTLATTPSTSDFRANLHENEPQRFETTIGPSDSPTIEGTTADVQSGLSPSSDGPLNEVISAMSKQGVPKRKSLNGLFGLALKRSLDKLKPHRKPSEELLTAPKLPPISLNNKTLRSLAEELETAEICTKIIGSPSSASPYRARRATFTPSPSPHLFKQSDANLRRVASATDKLSNLVCLDFSPSNTTSNQASLAAPPSLTSLDGSPTPMRRVRSVVLTNKKSQGSPLRAGTTISPLKLALRRNQMASKPTTPRNDIFPKSPKTSLVRKGMRNVFAPPTPPPQPKLDASRLKASDAAKSPKTRPPHLPVVNSFRASSDKRHSDVPDDLSAMFGEGHLDPVHSLSQPCTLGLPPAPPIDRVTPRRAARAPPKASLPPVPDMSAAVTSGNPPTLRLTVDPAQFGGSRTSAMSDLLTPSISEDFRNSFDFTSEYASLDVGYQRASFVEALAQVRELKSPELPLTSEDGHSTTAVSEAIEGILGDFTVGEDDSESFIDDALDEEAQISIAQVRPSPRRVPFQGQAAFQKRVAESKTSPTLPEESLEFTLPAAVSPVTAPTHRPTHRQHRRNESGFSIASISSLGSVIESGIAEQHKNYFEIHFAHHLREQDDTRSSTASHTRSRSHHRRNSSILSFDSFGEEFGLGAPSVGPPVSMHNPKRSSYISRHRRGGSGEEASFSRSDWASHRRNTSTDSTNSIVSVTRLGRPGLGERMFQLDGGVQLTSITGSPPDEVSGHRRQWSFDSLLDRSEMQLGYDSLLDASIAQTEFDSLLDISQTSRIPERRLERDSLFGGEPLQAGEKTFLLKGLRPDSMISASGTEGSGANDTFDLGRRTFVDLSPVSKGPTACLQADGEDATMTARQLSESANSGRQVHNTSISRPTKPRCRPANLIFSGTSASQLDTPGLSSPSASETSSRLSLETKFSDASVFTASRIRPHGAGHQRQKSSQVVNCGPTIKEEPSIATLRAARGEPKVVGWEEEEPVETVRWWLEWKREADDEFRRTRNYWADTDESKNAVQEFKMLTTPAEISAFLQQSTAAYKPLEDLPVGKIAHRRKSSLADARQNFSPYGLPLPKPPTQQVKKVSLQTKFERTNSATSSNFRMSDPPSSTSTPSHPAPPSAVFAEFARELPVSPPPVLATMTRFSPLQMPFDAFGLKSTIIPDAKEESRKAKTKEKRERVSSSARRQALGWGRRRNSDGPAQVDALAQKAENLNITDNNVDLPLDLQEAVGMKFQPRQRVVPGENSGKRAIKATPPVPQGQENLKQTRKAVKSGQASTTTRKAKRTASQPLGRALRS